MKMLYRRHDFDASFVVGADVIRPGIGSHLHDTVLIRSAGVGDDAYVIEQIGD